MNNKLIATTITVTIVVVLVATMLVPAISTADEEFTPVYTNGSESGIKLNVVDSVTVSKAAGTSDTVTINGTDISLNSSANAIVLTDTFVINARTTNFYVITSTTATNVNAATAFTATIEEGTITYQVGTATAVTLSYSGTLLAAATDGAYINVASGTAYTDSLDKVFGWNWANNKLYSSAGQTCTVGGVSGSTTNLAATASDVYEPLYTMTVSSIVFDVDGDEVAPNTIIVPTSFTTYMKGSGAVAASLFDVLPILIIVSLVLVATTLIVRKND